MTRGCGPARLIAICLLLLLTGCSDDDDAAAPAEEPQDSVATSTTRAPSAGGLDILEIPGTSPAPVPDLGFGIAIPDGWQAVVLTDDALGRLEDADLARPSFLDAARSVAATGAVFYAAGVDDEARVAELKIDVQDDAATDPASVRAVARAVVDSGRVDDATVIEGGAEEGRIRVDYRVTLPSADDGAPIDAYGSQLFVVDGDRLWSFIITSEDEATQQALLDVFERSIAFD